MKHALPIICWSAGLAVIFVATAYLFVRPGAALKLFPAPDLVRRILTVPVTAFLSPAYALERLGAWSREAEGSGAWLAMFLLCSLFWGILAHFAAFLARRYV